MVGPPVHSPSPSWLAFVAEFLAVIGVVDVVIVVKVEGCCEAFKPLLTSTRQKDLMPRRSWSSVCFPSPSWLVLVTRSLVTLGVGDAVVVVEVGVQNQVLPM